MPTTVTSKIGATNSPTTMDYSTLQAWEDACPANLVTSDQIWKGECYDQGEFSSAGKQLTISGTTTDATRYIWLTCASGASFRDKSGVRTTALAYSSANGVASKSTGNYNNVLTISVNYTRVDSIQWQNTGGTISNVVNVTGNRVTFDGNIVLCTTGSNGITASTTNNIIVTNNLIYGGALGTAVTMGTSGGGTPRCIGNTLIRTSAGGTQGVIPGNYGAGIVKNNAIFGFTASWNGASVAAGSGYNATDAATAPGSTGNQTSLTFASQFVSTSTDFRAVDTGSLDLNATPDTTYMPLDISKTTRNAATPTIGCWEVVASAGNVVNPALIRKRKSQSILLRM